MGLHQDPSAPRAGWVEVRPPTPLSQREGSWRAGSAATQGPRFLVGAEIGTEEPPPKFRARSGGSAGDSLVHPRVLPTWPGAQVQGGAAAAAPPAGQTAADARA